MRYLMFIINVAAFLAGIANTVYSCFVFKKRYMHALNAMGEKDTVPNLGYDAFKAGLCTIGINLLFAIVGIVVSLFDGLPTEGQQKPFIDLIIVFFVLFVVCIVFQLICRKKISNVNQAYAISNSKERTECLSKITMISNGFINLIILAVFLSVFQATVIAYDFILCFL